MRFLRKSVSESVGFISCACPESSVSQRQRDGESQKLSRYITNEAQAIQADQDMNGAGQDSMPTILLQNNTSNTVSMSIYGREKNPGTPERCHAKEIFHCSLKWAKGKGDWSGWKIHLGLWVIFWDTINISNVWHCRNTSLIWIAICKNKSESVFKA